MRVGSVGRGGIEGGVEDLVRAFLFLHFDLTDCHTQSTPSLSFHPSVTESLCFHGNHLLCLPDNAPPPTHTHTNTRQPPAPCTPNRQCSDNDGAAAIQGVWAGEREDVTWMEEKERAKRQRMEGEKERAKAERGIRGYTKGLRKTEEPRNR